MSAITATLALWVAAWSSTAIFAVVRALARRRAPLPVASAISRPSVIIVRPCAGAPHYLASTLTSVARIPRASAWRVIHAVASNDDPACAIVHAVSARLRDLGIDARVVVTGAPGPNRKAGQLWRALEAQAADIFVVADADVALDETALEALLAPLLDGSPIAATFAPPIEAAPPRTLGDRTSRGILGGSLHAFALLAALDGGGLVGKLMAVRASALAEIGGFEALRAYLGEDMELARRLRARGLRVVATASPACSMASGRTFGEVVRRYARWIAVIRAQRPWLLVGYPALLAASPLMVLAAVLAGAPSIAFVVLALRVALALAASLRSGARPLLETTLFGAALADFTLLLAFARALAARTVEWNHVRFSLSNGTLVEEREGAP